MTVMNEFFSSINACMAFFFYNELGVLIGREPNSGQFRRELP